LEASTSFEICGHIIKGYKF